MFRASSNRSHQVMRGMFQSCPHNAMLCLGNIWLQHVLAAVGACTSLKFISPEWHCWFIKQLMYDCSAQLCSLCPCNSCFVMCVVFCQGVCWCCDWRAVMDNWWQQTFFVWALRRECQSIWIRLLNGKWNFCTPSWLRHYSSLRSSRWCRSATSLQSIWVPDLHCTWRII